MILKLELPLHVEEAVRARAQAAGMDVETFVMHVVEDEVADALKPPRMSKVSAEEFARRTEAWVKLHPALDHAIDDSRESMDAGRGE